MKDDAVAGVFAFVSKSRGPLTHGRYGRERRAGTFQINRAHQTSWWTALYILSGFYVLDMFRLDVGVYQYSTALGPS